MRARLSCAYCRCLAGRRGKAGRPPRQPGPCGNVRIGVPIRVSGRPTRIIATRKSAKPHTPTARGAFAEPAGGADQVRPAVKGVPAEEFRPDQPAADRDGRLAGEKRAVDPSREPRRAAATLARRRRRSRSSAATPVSGNTPASRPPRPESSVRGVETSVATGEPWCGDDDVVDVAGAGRGKEPLQRLRALLPHGAAHGHRHHRLVPKNRGLRGAEESLNRQGGERNQTGTTRITRS